MGLRRSGSQAKRTVPLKNLNLYAALNVDQTTLIRTATAIMGEIDVQRFLCQKCGDRFSEKPLNDYKETPTIRNRQLGVLLQGATKKLTEATKINIVAGRENHYNTPQEVKGKIVELCFHMQKQGYSPTTM